MNEKNEKPESGQKTGTKKSGLAREGIAYLIFGVLTTVIDYAISNLLYYMWKMDPVPAQTIAWVAAVLFAFVTNVSRLFYAGSRHFYLTWQRCLSWWIS